MLNKSQLYSNSNPIRSDSLYTFLPMRRLTLFGAETLFFHFFSCSYSGCWWCRDESRRIRIICSFFIVLFSRLFFFIFQLSFFFLSRFFLFFFLLVLKSINSCICVYFVTVQSILMMLFLSLVRHLKSRTKQNQKKHHQQQQKQIEK